MKTSERLLAALRHTDDDILDLDREIHSAEDQLARQVHEQDDAT